MGESPGPLTLRRSRGESVPARDHVEAVVGHFGVPAGAGSATATLLVVMGRDPGRGTIHAAALAEPGAGLCGEKPHPVRSAGGVVSQWSVLAVVEDDRTSTAVSALHRRNVALRRLCRACYPTEAKLSAGRRVAAGPGGAQAAVTVTLSREAVRTLSELVASECARPAAGRDELWEEIRGALAVRAPSSPTRPGHGDGG